jgi:hypothetical protein
MPSEFSSTHIHQYDRTDPRMGRHVRHDSRSLRYAYGVLPKSAIVKTRWTRRTPILDQGQIGDCVPNALTGVLGTDSAQRPGLTSVTVKADSHGVFAAGVYPLDEPFAVQAYSLITLDDAYPGNYPPDDTGSDGLGAMAGAKDLGLVDVYQHAFSITAVQSALMAGPVMWGTEWLNSMFTTDRNGFLVVNKASGVAGGHELVLNGYDPGTDTYSGDNSWGPSFGLGGSFFISGANLKWLLSRQGDITVPHWVTDAPAPGPVPVPGPVAVTDAQFWGYAKQWAAGRNLV